MNNRPQQITPLQQLIADKRSLRRRLREEEQELDEGWQLVRDNAGRLILTGLSRLFFPAGKIHPLPLLRKTEPVFGKI